jgi:hypothetical protein
MRLTFLATACILVAGCATGYHSENIAGGFGDVRLDQNTFRITFKGNVTSKQAETDEQALLHAAELARANGFPYFVSSGAAPLGTAVSLATNVISAPASTLTITCFTYRPETTAVVYEADRVIATLGAKYDKRGQ